METKIFLLNSNSSGEANALDLHDVAKSLDYDVDIDFSQEPTLKLPRDYDIYVLHASDTTEEAIAELKREQPWSMLFGLLGGTDYDRRLIDSKLLDRHFFETLTKEKCEIVLREAKDFYENIRKRDERRAKQRGK
jgi:hypothetical protein